MSKPVDPATLEVLDRLVEKGEMVCTPRFSNLIALMNLGYATSELWHNLLLVKPTEEGIAIAKWRAAQRLHSTIAGHPGNSKGTSSGQKSETLSPASRTNTQIKARQP